MSEKKLKILLINVFFHIEGGADTAFFNTAELLTEKGHEVIYFCMHHPRNKLTKFNKYFVSYIDLKKPINFRQKLRIILRLFWSFDTNRKLEDLIKKEKPDMAHIHNIHFEISPSILFVLKKHKIPIVMTLHDYVLVCPLRLMFVKDEICENCKGGSFLKVIKNKCIRNSFLASLIVYLSFLFHTILKTFSKIDLFIAPSNFLANKFKEMDSQYKIIVINNCFRPFNINDELSNHEKVIIYFGRLEYYKGIDMLIEAVNGLDIILKIIGSGSIEEIIQKKIKEQKIKNVVFLGYMNQKQLVEEIKKCLFTVVPSFCYEIYPYSILESFSISKPVIGSNIGGITELIKDGERGLIFEYRKIESLRTKIKILVHNQQLLLQMGANARRWVIENHNFDKHYNSLNSVYNKCVKSNKDFKENY